MNPLRAFLRDETGTASIEFVFVVPIIVTIFTASFESSFYMARHVMLERSVDLVVRDIRLGKYATLTHNALKQKICERSALVESVDTCIKAMKIWLQPISTANFVMAPSPNGCVDRNAVIDPLVATPTTEFKFGVQNEIMLMRVCLKEKPMFPTTAVGAQLIKDGTDGHYGMVTMSVFVNEPT